MVTGHKPERLPFARLMAQSFLNQTYERSYLLVLNEGESLGFEHERIDEKLLGPSVQTLGELRNLALDMVKTPFIMQWDDDDWCRSDRVAYQMAAMVDGVDRVTLGHQLCYDWTTGECVHKDGSSWDWGFPGTILHRATAARYPHRKRGEDSVFIRRFGGDLVILDNDPAVYVRTYTGHNTWDQYHVVKACKHREVDIPEEVELMLRTFKEMNT